MLKGIPSVLSPELLKTICEMGHGDSIVIADGNFPIGLMGKDARIIRCDGHGCCEIMDAVLQLFPLDPYVESPVTLMQLIPGDTVKTPIWDEYHKIAGTYDKRGEQAFSHIERFAFYEKAKKAYAIVATGEKALYANMILQKGVV